MTGLSEEPKKLWERRTELRRLKCLSKRSWRPRNIASSLNGTVEKRGLVTLTAANLAILDTSVYVDNLRSGRFKQEILDLKFVIRCSAVVLAELSRGARSREMKRFVEDLAKNLRIIAPNEREWVQSGRIVNRLVAAKGRYSQNQGDSLRRPHRANSATNRRLPHHVQYRRFHRRS